MLGQSGIDNSVHMRYEFERLRAIKTDECNVELQNLMNSFGMSAEPLQQYELEKHGGNVFKAAVSRAPTHPGWHKCECIPGTKIHLSARHVSEFNKEKYHIGAALNEHSQRMIASHEWSVNYSPQAEFERIPHIPVLMRLDPKNAMLMNTSIVAFVNRNSIELDHVLDKRRSTTDQQVDANTSTMIMMIRSIIGLKRLPKNYW